MRTKLGLTYARLVSDHWVPSPSLLIARVQVWLFEREWSHSLMCLNAWSSVCGSVWEGLGGLAFIGSVSWRWNLKSQKSTHSQLTLLLSASCLWIRMVPLHSNRKVTKTPSKCSNHYSVSPTLLRCYWTLGFGKLLRQWLMFNLSFPNAEMRIKGGHAPP